MQEIKELWISKADMIIVRETGYLGEKSVDQLEVDYAAEDDVVATLVLPQVEGPTQEGADDLRHLRGDDREADDDDDDG